MQRLLPPFPKSSSYAYQNHYIGAKKLPMCVLAEIWDLFWRWGGSIHHFKKWVKPIYVVMYTMETFTLYMHGVE